MVNVAKFVVCLVDYTNILSLNIDDSEREEAFTRLASRVAAFIVINRQSRVEEGSPSVSISSSSHSFAEISACCDPNNWAIALKNADNSRSAVVMKSGQRELNSFDC
jgi:hypothetical protein